ncbi:MAG TPA: deoxyribodipyrimidine photolyase, partial [Methylomirabilota bacterium]|nr:deoxyribodipyrimidine photolyase [Methylomirabilota bacterium]
MPFDDARLRRVNECPESTRGDYVLYWMQSARRLDHNHALDYALAQARRLQRPLVVYEGLRLDYPWASRRLHRFILEGMQANSEAAKRLGLTYWPWVERRPREGRGRLAGLAARA